MLGITPAAEINPATSPACPLTEEQWAEQIRPNLELGAVSYISAGRKLIQAKKTLKSNGGSFTNLVTVRLGWDLDTAERWMEIARNPVLADSATLRNLPTSWTTLYQLSRLPAKTLEKYIQDGTVHPALTCRAAYALVNRGSGSTHSELMTTTHTESFPVTEPEHSTTVETSEPATVKMNGSTGAVETIGPNSPGEIERKLARLDELERERSLWQTQRLGYESEIEELRAKLGSETGLHHPRRLFRRALEALQKSDTPNLVANEKRGLVNGAVIDLIELVRSLQRDGLKLNRIDLFCRPELHS